MCTIFTDGSCRDDTKRAGYGVHFAGAADLDLSVPMFESASSMNRAEISDDLRPSPSRTLPTRCE